VLNRRYDTGAGAILDFLDADPAWALVFVDDAAAVYVRRTGPLAAVADAHAYQWLAGGTRAMAERFDRAVADSASRLALIAELERASRESPWDARTQEVLARLAFGEGRLDDARRHLERRGRVSPLTVRLHERLGIIALAQGRPADALAEFQARAPQPHHVPRARSPVRAGVPGARRPRACDPALPGRAETGSRQPRGERFAGGARLVVADSRTLAATSAPG
jgi:hypothetical protein